MGQLVVYGLLAIVLAGVLFLLATRFLPAGEQIAPPLRDEQPWNLPPDRELRAEDVDQVRLPVSLRGYRFAETDVLLDRLAEELRSRELEIARLRGHREPGGAVGAPGMAEVVADHPAPAPGDWAPAVPAGHPAAPQGDAPQPPPFADEERPVTDTPVVRQDTGDTGNSASSPDDDRR